MNRWRYTRRIAALARRLGIGHNPLRRNVDQFSLGESAAQTATRHQITAVLTEPAPLTMSEYPGMGGPPVHARWSGPNGIEHTDVVTAAPGDPTGAPVRIWIDNAGNLATAPVTTAQAGARGTLTVVGVMIAVVTVLGTLLALAHTRLERLRAKAWAAHWRQIGPRWTTHAN